MKFKDIREFKKTVVRFSATSYAEFGFPIDRICYRRSSTVCGSRSSRFTLSETDQGDAGLKEIIRQIVHCRMFLER